MPRDILDAPGPLPGEPVTASDPDPYADETPEERAARLAWPELPWTPGEYAGQCIGAAGGWRVVIPRAWLDCELPPGLTWTARTVSLFGDVSMVIEVFCHDRPSLACLEADVATFEGTYIPSRGR